MDTVVASMGVGQITVIAIGCGMGALLVGAVGAFFCIHLKQLLLFVVLLLQRLEIQIGILVAPSLVLVLELTRAMRAFTRV